MHSQTELQALFETMLGSRNVYFQPPESVKINYPAIIYRLDTLDEKFADNILYNYTKAYSITLIDKKSECSVFISLLNLPMCSFDRQFITDNLYHYVFKLFY